MGGALNPSSQKQLFTNIDINVFVPKDPTVITSAFKVIDMIEDEFEKLDRLHFVCEVASTSTGETLLQKALDHFNDDLKKSGSSLRFDVKEPQNFSIRIAKRKNGKPNSDYPKVDISRNIVDIDFTHFCIVYEP